MPNGLGIYHAKETTLDERRLLRLVPLATTGSNTLTKTAIAAVRGSLQLPGIRLRRSRRLRAGSPATSARRTATDWALVAVLALGSLVACLLLLAVGSRWHSRKREIELTQPMGVRHSGRVLLIHSPPRSPSAHHRCSARVDANVGVAERRGRAGGYPRSRCDGEPHGARAAPAASAAPLSRSSISVTSASPWRRFTVASSCWSSWTPAVRTSARSSRTSTR